MGFIVYLFSICRFLNLLRLYQLEHYNLEEYRKNFLKRFFNFNLLFYRGKVKLKFTKRIDRQIFIYLLLTFYTIDCIYIACINFMIVPIIFALTCIISNPIEKFVNKRFWVKAMRKLDSADVERIAITGSFGKTSVKNYIDTIVGVKYNTVSSPRSFNTPMGLSKFINDVDLSDKKFIVAEMGARRIGEINELCELISPGIGVITEIGKQHLDSFKSLENIIATKFELADYESIQLLVLNYDNPYIREKARNYSDKKIISYGSSRRFDYYYQDVVQNESGLSFKVYYDNKFLINVSVKLLGIHNVSNIVASIAVAHQLGLEVGDIKDGINNIKPVSNRLELKEFKDNIIIDDSFNSNEVGFINALDVLNTFEQYKVIITPGLVEVDSDIERINEKIASRISEVCNLCILVGRNGFKLNKYLKDIKVIYVNTFNEGFEYYKTIQEKNVLLIENDLPDNYL